MLNNNAAVDYFNNLVPGPFNNPCNPAGAGGLTGATPANNCFGTRADSFSALSWTAGIDYHLTDDVMVYAKAGRGYRAGGENAQAFNDIQFKPFDAEYTYEQEVGLKSQFLDRKVQFNLAAYRNLDKNAQRTVLQTFFGQNNTIVLNAANVRNLGFEADLQVVPVTGVRLGGSVSYNKAKYLKYLDGNGADLSTERLRFLPEWKYTVFAEWSPEVVAGVSTTLNVDYAWTGSQATDNCSPVYGTPTACWSATAGATNSVTGALLTDADFRAINAEVVAASTLRAVGLLNARFTVGFEDDKYTISAWGRNLTNQRDYTVLTLTKASNRNWVSGVRRDPATYGVTVGAKF